MKKLILIILGLCLTGIVLAQNLDDLIFRRTGLGENPRRAMEMLPRLRPLFPWSDPRWQQECERVHDQLRARI